MNEAVWTPPTDLCPNPQHWTANDIDATENEVLELLYGLVRGLQPEVCVETGTYLGDGSRAIASALKANGHGHLFTFETNPENWAEATRRLVDLSDWVTFFNNPVGNWEPPSPVDFTFFDSSFGGRVLEFHDLHPYMTQSTVVTFHDTAPHHPLRPLLDAPDIPAVVLIDLPTPRGISIGQLPRPTT